ncbi:hypothetical protein SO802_026372 [Lithocarpus litseifolius]|uniref:Uncharacterized protein n=1 Tax=Lithocarpus litseifolius TaxID=425828 RepID=A0AAW2C191_9ROSI
MFSFKHEVDRHREENLRKIGSHASIVLEVDVVGDGGSVWKKFIRIKVKVDLSEPLLLGNFLPRSNQNYLWISLKYKKLADIFYNCSLTGHVEPSYFENVVLIRNLYGHRFKASRPWLTADYIDALPNVYTSPCLNPTAEQASTINFKAPPKHNQKMKQPNETITLDADVPPTNYNTTGSVRSALKQLLNVMTG